MKIFNVNQARAYLASQGLKELEEEQVKRWIRIAEGKFMELYRKGNSARDSSKGARIRATEQLKKEIKQKKVVG